MARAEESGWSDSNCAAQVGADQAQGDVFISVPDNCHPFFRKDKSGIVRNIGNPHVGELTLNWPARLQEPD